MNEALKMQISAFVDGELPADEAELLTRQLSQDPALREEAARYLEIGRALRGERTVAGIEQLGERIAAALAEEPLPAAATGESRWLRPAAGFAIAASVAVLALVGLQNLNLPGTPDSAVAAAVAVDTGSYTEPSAREALSDQPASMLTQYYLRHGETSGELGANGILGRLVTLELRGGELVEIQPVADTATDEGEGEASEPAPDNASQQQE